MNERSLVRAAEGGWTTEQVETLAGDGDFDIHIYRLTVVVEGVAFSSVQTMIDHAEKSAAIDLRTAVEQKAMALLRNRVKENFPEVTIL